MSLFHLRKQIRHIGLFLTVRRNTLIVILLERYIRSYTLLTPRQMVSLPLPSIDSHWRRSSLLQLSSAQLYSCSAQEINHLSRPQSDQFGQRISHQISVPRQLSLAGDQGQRPSPELGRALWASPGHATLTSFFWLLCLECTSSRPCVPKQTYASEPP